MNKNQVIELCYEHHNEWVDTVKSLYGNNIQVVNYAEDFVQEMYAKLLRYDDLANKIIKKDGTISKGYVFFTLRSIIINSMVKKQIKYNFENFDYDMEEKYNMVFDDIDEEMIGEDKLIKEMWKSLKENLHWFDVRMLSMYLLSKMTYKQIASETGLAYQTIFLAIKRCKQHLMEEFSETYEDYLNGDYSKI